MSHDELLSRVTPDVTKPSLVGESSQTGGKVEAPVWRKEKREGKD
jgi:hypothetical protein